jgi:uncharacterized protein YaaW (UPF0174 family)
LLFSSHRQLLKDTIRQLCASLQSKIIEVVDQQVALIMADLQMLQDENVILESERNPEFRARLAAELSKVTDEAERIGRVFEGA